MAQQEGVSGILGGGRVIPAWSAVELEQGELSPPVVHVIEQRAIPARELHGLEDVEVGGVLDGSAGVSRGAIEVDELPIEGVPGIELAVESPHDLLVRSGGAEALARRERLTPRDL